MSCRSTPSSRLAEELRRERRGDRAMSTSASRCGRAQQAIDERKRWRPAIEMASKARASRSSGHHQEESAKSWAHGGLVAAVRSRIGSPT